MVQKSSVRLVFFPASISASFACSELGMVLDTKPSATFKIMCLVDGSFHSDAAFDAAVQLKKPEHALLLVHSYVCATCLCLASQVANQTWLLRWL